jgi:DHA1 family tetracycline resistance protein-like MFS transporter
VQLRFRETLKNRRDTPLDLFSGFRNIGRAFTLPKARTIFLVVFLLAFGFNFFTQFFQAFLIQKFQFTQSHIGDIFAYIGLWSAITQGLINRPLTKRLEPPVILSYSALLLAVALPCWCCQTSLPSFFSSSRSWRSSRG